MSEQQLRDWLRLARTENVGPVTFAQLLARYGDAGKALAAIPELAAQGGLKRKLSISAPASIDEELYRVSKLGAQIITLYDANYPKLLRELTDAPPALTIQGHISLLDRPTVAIVGARNASLNGRRFAEKLARDLAGAGYTVVSGLAAGIDASAHTGALAQGTVGVVAGGIDQIYPPENETLHKQMAQTGLIVAEMPHGTPINAKLFPRRNRIVSGLSRGVIVIEAAIQSGSLITARLAADQGREVMAVPGSPLDPRSAGTNKLIKDGATLIEGAADVITALGQLGAAEPEYDRFSAQPTENIDESLVARLRPQVLEALSPTPTLVDDIIRVCQTPPSAVLAVLLELELAGRLIRMPGNQVALLLDIARAVNE